MVAQLQESLARKRNVQEAQRLNFLAVKRESKFHEELALLKLRRVCDLIGFEKSWLWAAVKSKRFPAPHYIGSSNTDPSKGRSSPRWSSHEVIAWIGEQVQRNGKA